MQVTPPPTSSQAEIPIPIDVGNPPSMDTPRPAATTNEDGDPNLPARLLVHVALSLAALEKGANTVATLGLIWASTVVLGGFPSSLIPRDFWTISLIISFQGIRVFCHEEMLRANINSWRSEPVVLHFMGTLGKVFQGRKVSRILYVIQWIPAVCIPLSSTMLVLACFEHPDTANVKGAVIIFYGLALLEGLLSLAAKLYWTWNFFHDDVMWTACRVSKLDEDLTEDGMLFIRLFFSHIYAEAFRKSIADRSKPGFVSFASTELLESDSLEEQHIGVRVLWSFASRRTYSADALHNIGTSVAVMDRLVWMLTWKRPDETHIRQVAAEIVCLLATKKYLSIERIPGGIDSIISLVDGASNISILGLKILNELAKEPINCEKLRNMKALRSKVSEFAFSREEVTEESRQNLQALAQQFDELVGPMNPSQQTI